MVTFNIDLVLIVLAFTIGYISDNTGPQKYHHQGTIVVVNEKYQCPKHCGVMHHHSVYFEDQSIGMFVYEEQLGKKHKEEKKRRR